MDGISIAAFADELEKTAFLKGLWQRIVTGIFGPEEERQKSRVDYFYSPRAGPDKWTKFDSNIKSPEFLAQVTTHKKADPKLVQFAHAMHSLSNAKTVGKIQSERLSGKTYEIRSVPTGLACTCPDWKFVGSTRPGYECKHIRAYKLGKAKV